MGERQHVERFYEYAVADGAPVEVIRKGFDNYLGPNDHIQRGTEVPESVKLLERVLSLGGQPSFHSIVEAGYDSLAEELLKKCPERQGTQQDDPRRTVFENLCNASSWVGQPRVMELAMFHCPHLHSAEHAMRAICRAIVSHNRFGSVDDYGSLIETQLKYLKEEGSLADVIEEGSFLPNHKVARHYLWPDHYGYGESKSSVESMIDLTELLMSYGFDAHRANSDGFTPVALAEARRKKGHPGMAEYIAFLNSAPA